MPEFSTSRPCAFTTAVNQSSVMDLLLFPHLHIPKGIDQHWLKRATKLYICEKIILTVHQMARFKNNVKRY